VGVPKKYGFFASFVIPGCAMLVAVFVFFGGSSRYYKLPPSGSAFTRFVRVFMKAAKNTQLGSKILFGLFLIVLGMLATIVGFFIPESTQGSALNVHVIVAISGMVFMGCGLIILIHYGGNASWIYSGAKQSIYVKAEYTHKDVTDAYQVARLLPYLALITMFWACYGQMNNNFGKLHMTYMYVYKLNLILFVKKGVKLEYQTFWRLLVSNLFLLFFFLFCLLSFFFVFFLCHSHSRVSNGFKALVWWATIVIGFFSPV